MRKTAILIMLCGVSFAAEPKNKDRKMNDNESLQGTWELVSGERHGQAFPEAVVKGVRLEFSGDSLSTKNKDHVSKAKFKLHSDTIPKGIDLDMDGSIGQGIYQLDGDTLTILHGEVMDNRPTKFDPQQTSRLTLLVLKRSRPIQPSTEVLGR